MNSLESVLADMAQLMLGESRKLYPKFQERVRRLIMHADRIGWGYGDGLLDYVSRLENKLAGT